MQSGKFIYDLCYTAYINSNVKQNNEIRNTMNINPLEILKDMQNKVEELIQNSPAKDVQAHIKSAMNNTFTKLDLVTREEFDIQAEVLQATRLRLEALEKQVHIIMEQLDRQLSK
jgi:ubiquinone biosynthesis accessory factor UbiK